MWNGIFDPRAVVGDGAEAKHSTDLKIIDRYDHLEYSAITVKFNHTCHYRDKNGITQVIKAPSNSNEYTYIFPRSIRVDEVWGAVKGYDHDRELTSEEVGIMTEARKRADRITNPFNWQTIFNV